MSSTRRAAREIALQMLFQAEFFPDIQATEFGELFEGRLDPQAWNYAQNIYQGVRSKVQSIDAKIAVSSKSWAVDRMSIVDKSLIRMICYEMIFSADPIPKAVAINEGVDIARKYGSTDSGAFVNGVLDALARDSQV